MKSQDVAKIYSEYVLPTYKRFPVCLVKGKGSRVWDIEGHAYLDFFPGWAVSGLGHCHPAVVNAIKHQARKMLHISNNFLNLKQAELAREIVLASFPGQVFFCNSGAEATEAALKFARRYGAETGRFEVITMKQSFHGRTFGALSATAQDKIQNGFAPVLSGFRYAEFNDLSSVEQLLSDKTIGIFLEPIQGEGGIRMATQEFMLGLRRLCDKRDILLILDEVQTGMGRTGKMFAYEHYGITPDLMTLAKSLGSGVPIGALVVSQKVRKEVMTPGTHGSTYGGNPLVAAAALAVFKAIKQERLLHHVVKMGDYLGGKLEGLKQKFSFIEEVRGIGLMRALKLTCPGAVFVDSALAKGLIINCTQENVLRIMPAMTVTARLIDQAMAILTKVFKESLEK